MPFAVFRRHQRKLLAIFAILAMLGFVLADSLPRLLGPGSGPATQNRVVVDLYHKSIRQGDLNEMAVQRNNANQFMAGLVGRPLFGDMNTRALVDALILQHEADLLRMPKGPEVGREWLKQATNGMMNRELFESALSRLGNRVSGEQVLSDIGNQVRIANARRLMGEPVVTPLDVFQIYRDQNERVAARAVAFRVDDYIRKVAEPTTDQVRAYFEKYKDELPDPDRETPGFKIPRQIKAEVLSIDGAALAKGIKDKLTQAELLSYYENRKSEFKKPSEFPDDIFAGDPEAKLTPPQTLSFDEVRENLATALADEKAQAQIVNKFTDIKDKVMIPFADNYLDTLDEINEAKKQGDSPKVALPKPKDLAADAKQEGLAHEITPLLDREHAEHYGELGNAEIGLSRMSGGRTFAAELFDPKTTLYEPIELTDIVGRRYLVRKLDDNPPRVPALDEIRLEVVRAWKLEQARPLAEKAANDLAAELRKADGKIKGETIKGLRVINTIPITKLRPGMPVPGQFFQMGPPTPSEIPQLPNAGDALRDAYFNLTDGAVNVAPDQPKSTYYVLTLAERLPATFATLYSPNGEYYRYRSEALDEARRHRQNEWMGRLRAEAGIKPDWVPLDESRREERDSSAE